MSVAPVPPVRACPFDPAFECRWVGDALPPDGAPPERAAGSRCPPGYLPHRRRPPPELQGKVVVTGRPAERRPEPGENASGEPPKPAGPNPRDR